MKNRLLLIFLAAMLAVMPAMLAGCSGSGSDDADVVDEEDEITAEAGDFADLTDFSAYTADGHAVTQDYFADYDVTIVNVWATFCPPCLDEMPDIAELAGSLPDNVGMMLICTDGVDEADYMKEILDEVGFEGTNVVDGSGDYEAFLSGVQYVPTTVFVDSTGKMVATPVIGSSADPRATYFSHINEYFSEMGIGEIE